MSSEKKVELALSVVETSVEPTVKTLKAEKPGVRKSQPCAMSPPTV